MTLNEIECFILDMDGTIYLGEELIPGADKFIKFLKNSKKEFVFLTNNSSKNSANYQQKLQKLGIDISQNRIITSGEVTADYVKKRDEKASVYIVGTEKLKEDFKGADLKIKEDKEEDIDFLVLGFDTSLNYKKLWDAHDLILRGTKYIATNPDKVCPLENGATMPDCGAIIELLHTSTEKYPYVVGKPNTLMIDYISEIFGVEQGKIALVGDRLYTDIKTANKADIMSILVLSGETKRGDLEWAEQEPDLIINSIKDLYSSLV